MTDASESVLGQPDDLRVPETRLYSDGIVAGPAGPVIVPPHTTYRRHPRTAFLDPASGDLPGAQRGTDEQIRQAQDDVRRLRLPGRGSSFAEMAEMALADIEAVVLPNGAAVAAASPYWRYVWPRDASFLAAALVLVRRHDLARRILEYVAKVQEPDGTWQARYLADGSGDVPDGRGTQLDGNGWFLWAAWLLHTADQTTSLWPAARKALHAAIAATEHESGLVTPSQDFWEVDVDEPTLGVAAPLLLALRTGALVAEAAGENDLGAAARQRAAELGRAIDAQFGPVFPRRLSGGGPDASVAFLLPPFAPASDHVRAAWTAALGRMRVANGGLKPGAEWTDDQTAWTPQTALFAMTASYLGERELSGELLTWLERRRTRLGCLPEKVTGAGDPAGVAPLALTSATVLLALAAREGRTLPVPDNHPGAT